jgi:adenine-specific DNA-methyltransferase
LIVDNHFDLDAEVVIHHGDCRQLLAEIPAESVRLIVTSPPYNIGKPYERRRLSLSDYLAQQREIISECVRALAPDGSICWQVGNHVSRGEIFPLDIMLYPIFKELDLILRNRIVWHFEHGLHSTQRLSGRHESILWFTKTDDYLFDLDPIRVPQKYPAKKAYKGPRKGELTSNPLGKNPSDVWSIPNVKANHVEKTAHPCQFPVELVERLVLSMTEKGDWVVDPFMGAGSTLIAACLNGRKCAGAEIVDEYVDLTRQRIQLLERGELKLRPMGRPVYQPPSSELPIP